ncbi:MAG: hypothetical protein FIA89_07320 [Geobacter sp.]|nr:hypothetical protein [Geobacter sp.]
MNHAVTVLLFWLILVCLPFPVSAAGYYRYTDDAGTVCMTDKLANVPARYRSKAVLVPFEKKPLRKKTIESTSSADLTLSETVTSPAEKPVAIKTAGFRWNWLLLLLLGAGLWYASQRIEQRGLIARASRFRWAMLCLLAVLAYLLNRDIASSVTANIKERIDGLRQTIAEHEERDKKPLKTLSEVIEEKMNEAVK